MLCNVALCCAVLCCALLFSAHSRSVKELKESISGAQLDAGDLERQDTGRQNQAPGEPGERCAVLRRTGLWGRAGLPTAAEAASGAVICQAQFVTQS
jgi:hypothetical protein